MFLKTNIFLILICIVSALPSFGQRREGDLLYNKEYLVGINFHSNGGLIGGGWLRYNQKSLDGKNFTQLGLEVSFIKNPKELRYLNPVTNNSYILFKKNDLFVIRPQIGREFVLFRKAEEDGIQVDLILAGGPSFGFLKPYYIQYLNGTITVDEPYDPNVTNNPNNIMGSSPVTMGLNQCQVVPGLHFKPSLTFEMGHFNGNATGIEIGAMVEAFTQKMIILQPFNGMPDIQNKQVFTSVFLTVFYGFRR